ncbi:unnamed protein product [Tilletia caries]|nr:unnamed protein product [Tilletia caries]
MALLHLSHSGRDLASLRVLGSSGTPSALTLPPTNSAPRTAIAYARTILAWPCCWCKRGDRRVGSRLSRMRLMCARSASGIRSGGAAVAVGAGELGRPSIWARSSSCSSSATSPASFSVDFTTLRSSACRSS